MDWINCALVITFIFALSPFASGNPLMRFFLLLILSFPVFANNSKYVYLDCGRGTNEIERQYLILRIIPDESIESLDSNLKWETDGSIIDLDQYFFNAGPRYYTLNRSDLKLQVYGSFGTSHKTICSTTNKEKVEEEIQLIESKKRSVQKI